MEIKKMGILGVALTALALGACEKKSSSSNNSSGAAAVPQPPPAEEPAPQAVTGKCWDSASCPTFTETTEDACSTGNWTAS